MPNNLDISYYSKKTTSSSVLYDTIADTTKEDQAKPAKPVSLYEMIAPEREAFECQTYGTINGLPSCLFALNKHGLLVRRSPQDVADEPFFL